MKMDLDLELDLIVRFWDVETAKGLTPYGTCEALRELYSGKRWREEREGTGRVVIDSSVEVITATRPGRCQLSNNATVGFKQLHIDEDCAGGLYMHSGDVDDQSRVEIHRPGGNHARAEFKWSGSRWEATFFNRPPRSSERYDSYHDKFFQYLEIKPEDDFRAWYVTWSGDVNRHDRALWTHVGRRCGIEVGPVGDPPTYEKGQKYIGRHEDTGLLFEFQAERSILGGLKRDYEVRVHFPRPVRNTAEALLPELNPETEKLPDPPWRLPRLRPKLFPWGKQCKGVGITWYRTKLVPHYVEHVIRQWP